MRTTLTRASAAGLAGSMSTPHKLKGFVLDSLSSGAYEALHISGSFVYQCLVSFNDDLNYGNNLRIVHVP